MNPEAKGAACAPSGSLPDAARRAARRYGARVQPERADIAQPFVCTGRLYGEGRLYLLLVRPGARLLLEQPDYLERVSKGAHLTFDNELALRLAEAPGTPEGRDPHAT